MNKPCRPRDAPPTGRGESLGTSSELTSLADGGSCCSGGSVGNGSLQGGEAAPELGRGKRSKRRRLPGDLSPPFSTVEVDGEEDKEEEGGAVDALVLGEGAGGGGGRGESPWVDVVLDRMMPKVLAESYLTVC